MPRAITRRVRALLLVAAAGLVLTACGAPGGGPAGSTRGGAVPDETPDVSVSVNPRGAAPVNPTTPITIIASGGTLTEVAVTNTVRGTHVDGTFTNGHGRWTSHQVMGYGQTYRIDITARDNRGRTLERHKTVTTIDPARKAEPTPIPVPESVADTGVGVGLPLTIRFSQPVRDKAAVQQHLHVRSDPPQPGGWYWIDDKTVHYRPKVFWKPGTRITVRADVYGLDFGGGVYGATDRTATYRVHDSWIAKANGATKTMTVYHNGAPVRIMQVSLGKPGTPTHEGIHVVSAKHADMIMDSCTYGVCKGDPGYYREREKWAVRISNDGEFVHENLASLAEQGTSNVSHGCVNANTADATWFYHHFNIGDVVKVTHSGGPPLPVWDRYGDWSLPWPTWKAGDAHS